MLKSARKPCLILCMGLLSSISCMFDALALSPSCSFKGNPCSTIQSFSTAIAFINAGFDCCTSGQESLVSRHHLSNSCFTVRSPCNTQLSPQPVQFAEGGSQSRESPEVRRCTSAKSLGGYSLLHAIIRRSKIRPTRSGTCFSTRPSARRRLGQPLCSLPPACSDQASEGDDDGLEGPTGEDDDGLERFTGEDQAANRTGDDQDGWFDGGGIRAGQEDVLDFMPSERMSSTVRPGHVYFVSTPIGNLEDITLRAVRTLRQVDVVASEDTRHTSRLLRHLGVGKKLLVSHHEHNTRAAIPKLLQYAAQGLSIAVVSDAGTPGISDPGMELAAECAAASVPLVPVPGACAAIAALSISGYANTEFCFGGFLPRAGKARRQRVVELAQEPRAVILYEAPHRLLSTLQDLCDAGASARQCLCAREITKLHEQVERGTVSQLLSAFRRVEEGDERIRGEFTLVVAPVSDDELRARAEAEQERRADSAEDAVRARLARGESLSRAVKQVAAELMIKRSVAYDLGLRIQREFAEANATAQEWDPKDMVDRPGISSMRLSE
uniref:Tetrapyrrole methylase domain-containing protein n=1 Tax=Chrysotila carterae TaxID=13221 RepID=A0A7S4FCJ4_CHRCT